MPLLAVFQPTKVKVCPVMDYWELNTIVECHTGDDRVAVCSDIVRKWYHMQSKLIRISLR